MSSLLSLLTLGSNGIAAQNAGVGVATNNVANVNTDGYSRQRVDLRALPGAPTVGGVRALVPERFDIALLAGRIRTATGSFGMSRAVHDALLDLEGRLAGEGATIDEHVADFFARASEVTASPTDPQERDAVIAAARELAAAIQRRARAVSEAIAGADERIRADAEVATDLAAQLAIANRDVATSGDPALRDRRDLLARQLADKVGGAARIDADGHMRVTLDGGAVLVDGTRAARLEAIPDPSTGLARLEVVDGTARRDVTAELGGGTIGGELRFRDGAAATSRTALDQLAYDFATGVNAIHRNYAGLDGVTGRDLFVPPPAVVGAASAIAVDPALLADPTRLATAAAGVAPGDSTGAIALAGLRDALLAAGGTRTIGDAALDLVADVAFATAAADHEARRDALIDVGLAGLRDSIAGVDLDEELANLSRFEHASNAMTRFAATIDDLLGNLIESL